MLTKRQIALVLCSFILGTSSVADEAMANTATAKQFLSDYDGANADGKTFLQAVASATVDGMNWASASSVNQKPVYCLPSRLELGPEQIILIVRTTVSAVPTLGDQPFGFALLAGLGKTFPCQIQ